MSKIGLCSVRGCREKHYAKTFCSHHYHLSDGYKEINRKCRSGKEGERRERRKNRRYNESFKGRMTRKFGGKNLTKKEKIRAEEEFKKFDGKCQCCGSRKTSSKGWVLDHKGRKFRGILCVWCNVAAGFLKDSVYRAKKVMQYLRRTNGFNHKPRRMS
jgi:hypothetical protein